jgi:hypothetical protein
MNKSKMVFVAILLFALIPFTANATITRVVGMGGFDANWILKDAANPGIWPQLIREYPNLAGGDIAGNDFQKAYINYDFGTDKCVLQFSLDKNSGPMFMTGPNFNDPRFPAVPGDYNKLSLIYGRPIGDLLVGAAIRYAGKSFKQDANGQGGARDASYSTFGLNLGVSALEKNLDLALGFDFASFSDKQGGTEVLKNDGSMDIGFTGRYWYKANDRYALIPNVKFAMVKDAAKDPAANSKYAETTTAFALGLGNNWTPVEDMLAIFELGLMSDNIKYEITSGGVKAPDTKETDMDIYWRLGFETKIFGWLNGRVGAERNWVSNKDETIIGKPEFGASMTNTYIGATAHWNRLNLDLLVDPGWLQRGPYFIGGTQGNNMFSMVSLKYDFNK